ncbi:MAG: hypothetical protein QNJ32_24735 [Xenococcaceae cyanobacterium MO_167.B27]|nr:hypothetical protein [Xenococcaceae cyanobacterium MO_167.B27]
MEKNQNLTIRETTISEDYLLAQHFYKLWLDNNVTPNSIRADWLEVTIEFIAKARQDLSFQAWVAEADNQVIASASCQLFAGLYPPNFFKPDFRQYGYI